MTSLRTLQTANFIRLFGAFTAVVAVAGGGGCANKTSADAADGASHEEAVARVDEPGDEASAKPPYERGKPIRIGAANFRVSVVDRRAWPETEGNTEHAARVGYLRHGASVEAYENPFPNDECTDGWYELVGGGFVCGKAVTSDLSSPRIRLAPKLPDLSAGMPYRYGVNLRDGTPLYRRVLNNDDRKKYEPWLAPPKVDESDTAKTASAEATPSDSTKTATAEATPSTSDPSSTASASTSAASAAGAAGATTSEESETRTTGSGSSGSSGGEEESAASRKKSAELDAGVDASKPKLRELRGRGVLVRKMVRGFSLALDRDFKAAGTRWWRTTFGFAVPYDRIMVQPGRTKYRGTWFGNGEENPAMALLDGGLDAAFDTASALGAGNLQALANLDAGAAPELANAVGFVTTGSARKLGLSADGKRMTWGEEIPKRGAVLLTGTTIKVSGVTYHQTADGSWIRTEGLLFAKPSIPSDLQPNEKWIDVDLTRQALVAFEGTRPVFATLVSTGRLSAPDDETDFRTRPGSFRIREKHVTTTMDGDVASDGPYSIEDVPWVMYYDGSYALHGAFWHDSFGRPRSHGCVNLSPEDARTIFRWSDPPLPEGWHGVFATDEHPGSRVVVHEDKPAKRR